MTGNARRQTTVEGPCRDRISQLVGSLLEESQKPYSATLASHLVNCRSCLQTLVALEAAFELNRTVSVVGPPADILK